MRRCQAAGKHRARRITRAEFEAAVTELLEHDELRAAAWCLSYWWRVAQAAREEG